MGVLSIEFVEPTIDSEPCACCGGKTTRLTRFICSDGAAYAVYFATFSDNHPKKWVSALVSLGDWSEEATPEDRVSFAIQLRSTNSEYQVSLVDAEQSPWFGKTHLGKILNRQEALVHPWKADVFHITDHIVVEDKEIRGYLE